MKRSERMSKDGKMLAIAAVVVMIAASLACVVPVISDSETNAATTSTDVNISNGQMKQSIISVNETAFQFINTGKDGITVGYSTEATPTSFKVLMKYSNNDGTWGWDNNAPSANFENYKLDIVGKNGLDGKYTLQFTGEGVASEQTLTIRISITSQGATQSLDYTYNVTVFKSFTDTAKIVYEEGTGTVGGKFSTRSPTVYYSYSGESGNDSANDDLSNFVFYATGFNKGVGLTEGLKINGSVPDNITDTGWEMSSETNTPKMNLTFVVTDTRTGYMVTIDSVNVSYELTSGPVVDFTITYAGAANVYIGPKTSWTADDADSTVTIVSNSAENALKISSMYSDNKATVVKTADDGSTTVDTITLDEAGQSIDISGTGTIKIIVSVDGIDEKKITFIVIDDMTPVNDIDVTCGPVSSS